MLATRSRADTTAGAPDFDTLEIHVRAAQADGRRPVEMRLLGRRQDFPPGMLTLDEAALEALLERDPDEYGRVLGRALFCHPMGDSYAQCVAAVARQGGVLHVCLRLDDGDALQAARWERMHHPVQGGWEPLALDAGTPFSRWVYNGDARPPARSSARPLRVLAVVSSPRNLAAFGLDEIGAAERATLHAVLDAHRREIAVTYLESGTPAPPTLGALHRALARDRYDVVHFLCHGMLREVRPSEPGGRVGREAVLFIEWEEEEKPGKGGEARQVTGAELEGALKPLAEPPVLVFLAACESAARHPSWTTAARTLGQQLVWPGRARAAVAMSDRVGMATAREFVGTFYTRLHTHGFVDVATNEARASVRQQWDWSVPVLYSRLVDTQIVEAPAAGRNGTLDQSEHAMKTAGEALDIARSLVGSSGVDIERDVIDALEALIRELRKSHEVLVQQATAFRQTGADPADFRARFKAFYDTFKPYYDSRVWVDEDTSCHQVSLIRQHVVPRLRKVLDPASLQQLEQELYELSGSDTAILAEMGGFLEALDAVVEDVYALTLDPSPDALTRAIARKRDFELQISTRFRRSKAIIEQMNRNVRGAIAAA
jgi:hypothetical protein